MNLTFHDVKDYMISPGKNQPFNITIMGIDEEVLRDICLLNLIEKKPKQIRCPLCKSVAHINVEKKTDAWGKRIEVFYGACSNKAGCGLRTHDFWTKLDAENGWERLCKNG